MNAQYITAVTDSCKGDVATRGIITLAMGNPEIPDPNSLSRSIYGRNWY